MAITNGYITLAELQSAVDPSGVATWSATDDASMELAIEAASRWIDRETNAQFYKSTETRVFTAIWSDMLLLPFDLLSITSLKTDTTGDGTYDLTWLSTDYVLKPSNAALDNVPYRSIEIDRNQGNESFPTNVQNGVEIVGDWGYNFGGTGVSTEAPSVIRQACKLIAQRLWMRKDAIFGTAGTPALGTFTVVNQIQTDPDIMNMLAGISRRGGLF